MFGLGFSEILIVLSVALIVFGPKKLPEAARMMGRAMGEFRRTLDEIRYDLPDRPTLSSPRSSPRSATDTEEVSENQALQSAEQEVCSENHGQEKNSPDSQGAETDRSENK